MTRKYKSRGNGQGGITYCKGRKKPWRVRVTKGYEYDEESGKAKQVIANLGYFKTKIEAEKVVHDYLECPYDVMNKDITFSEVYEMWLEEYSKKVSSSGLRTVTAAYAYCSDLRNKRIRDIRSSHLKLCLECGYTIRETGKDKGKKVYASASTKSRMKSLFNLIFDYALERNMVTRNHARDFGVSDVVDSKEYKPKRKRAFSKKLLDDLWNNIGIYNNIEMVLINVYTGFRPKELTILLLEDVDLINRVIRGGLKTAAGKNRLVPIHPKIMPLVEQAVNKANQLGSKFLFNDVNSQTGINMTYDKYRKRFAKVMSHFGVSGIYSPHCCRVTFVTLAKVYEMDEHLLKRIIGHEDKDVTEEAYTRRDIMVLKAAMNKIPMELDSKYSGEDLYDDM